VTESVSSPSEFESAGEDQFEIKSNCDDAKIDVDSQGFPLQCAICEEEFDQPVKM